MAPPLPRPVRQLGWVSLLTDAATEAVYPLLPVFITRVLGGPPVAVGVIEGAADATSSLLKIAAGRLSDRLGRRKPIVVAGYTLSSFVRPFIALAGSWTHVLAIRVLDRVGKGLRGAPRDAMLAAMAPPDQRGRVFGYHWAMDHAGAAVGPLLATAFLWFAPEEYRVLFALTIVPGIGAVATLLRVPDSPMPQEPGAPRRSEVASGAPDAATGGRLPLRLKRYFVVLAVFTLGNSSDAFLLLQFSQLGVPLAGLTLLWSLQHAVKAGLSTRGGMLSDRFGRRTLIVAGWVIYAAVYAAFAASRSLAALIACFLCYSAYAAAVEGTEKALVADLAPAALHGTAFGWYAAVQGLGALGASLIFGALYQWYGAPAAFLTGAALALTAAAALASVRLSSPPPAPR
jgi:MFS family permease